ncbi:hypothetical protein EG68_09824 [Paragonimus skrjabini miyazakii]|uniref:EF-hand domain-containing protein n=1 Tax=Paragonimus skrjabini miyazakii TaxID=59628 RepID=A0A8S9YHC3_9TREM|nr:hypothetical protein EG68_09824 [Paragonimus skrjabini miyazakii]
MDPFINAFFQIDTDEDEVITVRDLEDYVKRNDLDKSMVTRWKSLFDKNHSGTITLNEFCDTLGLRLADVRIKRNESITIQQKQPGGLRSEIKVIVATMSLADQITVSEEVYRLVGDETSDKKLLADKIKTYLDKRYGRMWHVIISKGSSWCSFTHIPETSFFFQLKEYVYLIWRTPA